MIRQVEVNPELGERGIMDIYTPAGVEGPVPFIHGIHGGGWQNGDRKSYSYLWSRLAPLGIGLVLGTYRNAPEYVFPAAYEDVLGQWKWLYAHGAEYGLDCKRAGVFGSSAGGHLTMLLATRGIKETSERPEIRAVAQMAGIMDLEEQYAWDQQRGSTMTEKFIGGTPEELGSQYQAASPLFHVHENMPPIWMAHGSADPTVPFSQGLAMLERLKAANVDVIFHEARGLGHTLRETDVEGNAYEPLQLLFETDLLRHYIRNLVEVP